MEYPPLVAGQPRSFAVHLTRLDDFKPVNAGQAKVEFTPESGGQSKALGGRRHLDRVRSAWKDAPRRRAATAGRCILDGPGLFDRHDLGTITVFADEAAQGICRTAGRRRCLRHRVLKEPQWRNRVRDGTGTGSRSAHVNPCTGDITRFPAAKQSSQRLRRGGLVRQSCCRSETASGRARFSARLEPRLAAGADRATLAAEVAEAQRGC